MPTRKKQSDLFESTAFEKHNRLEHGGSAAQGKRKEYRPFDSKRPLHLVLRSSRARGEWSFLHPKNADRVEKLLRSWAKRFNVKLYGYANSGNHLHLVVKARTRKDFQNFLRTSTALLARLVTKASKANPVGKFWDALAFSRVVSWGKDFMATGRYLLRNKLEAIGYLQKGERVLSFREALANRGILLKT